ncbi:hypothetical protein BV20DRAFT_323794 [Pilatotrama ljubarskyi]|nr:hypothetical protein BV20DRAFT_323794 [Pilatotrama ljubarskyi]
MSCHTNRTRRGPVCCIAQDDDVDIERADGPDRHIDRSGAWHPLRRRITASGRRGAGAVAGREGRAIGGRDLSGSAFASGVAEGGVMINWQISRFAVVCSCTVFPHPGCRSVLVGVEVERIRSVASWASCTYRIPLVHYNRTVVFGLVYRSSSNLERRTVESEPSSQASGWVG